MPFQHGESARASASPGLGLGLPYVASVVQAYGGRLEVETDPGRGTAVTMYLPRHAA